MPALIHDLYQSPMSAAAIEAESFRRIDAEAQYHSYSKEQWEVVRRLIHTTADFGLIGSVCFSDDAIPSARAALRRGAPIYADAKMILAGLSAPRLLRVCPNYDLTRLVAHVSDPDVVAEASAAGLPRAVFALRKARQLLDGAILCFGNSPVGLMEASRLILEEGIRPALVLAMPVGFVHVVESKTELLSLGVPHITIAGRRGGSPLAVATLHALATLSAMEPT
jgi:precorrin isomerase